MISYKQSINYYEDLTPRDDVDKPQYLNSIEWALSNNNVENIAITGPLGSGKSSIIKTFQERFKNYRRI